MVQEVLTVVSGVMIYLLVWEVNCELRQQKGSSGVPETVTGKLVAGGVAGLAAFAGMIVINFVAYACPGVGITGTFTLCIGAFWARRSIKKKHRLAASCRGFSYCQVLE